MKADHINHATIQTLLNKRPAKGNPIPSKTEPDHEEPDHNPLKPKRKKKSELDIVML